MNQLKENGNSFSVLFIPLYHEIWASSRYRLYNFIPILKDMGIRCKVIPPPDRNPLARIIYLLNIFLHVNKFDIVFIQKKLFNRSILFFISRLNPKIIFDFDDALFAKPTSVNSKDFKGDRTKKLLKYTLRISKAVIAGNPFLKEYALQYNDNVHILPTPIATSNSPMIDKRKAKYPITLGWIGNKENLIYLKDLEPIFNRLIAGLGDNFSLKIICDASLFMKDVNIVNVKWSLENETEDLYGVDIGLMPLRDDQWSRGKCAFKILQFMSLGIPVIASPVGMNRDIIRHGLNGFLAESPEEWIECISRLMDNSDLIKDIGNAGRQLVHEKFTYNVTTPSLVEILRKCGSK